MAHDFKLHFEEQRTFLQRSSGAYDEGVRIRLQEKSVFVAGETPEALHYFGRDSAG